MWIDTDTMMDLLDGKLNEGYKDWLRRKVKYAEEREEERKRQRIAERNAFLKDIASIFQEYPDKRLCPTDIQFMYFHRYGKQISCSKVVTSLRMLRYYGTCDELPADLCGHLHDDLRSSTRRDQKDNHRYYFWK